jgi:hypothetical protein
MIEKVSREQFATYLDTTPLATAVWKLLGVGITSYGIAFNPQVTTEKWITNKNATSNHDSNQKQGDVSQKIYKNDPCFEYVYSLMDKTGSNVATHILDIDIWNEVSDGVYKAKKSDCIIVINSYMAEEAVIEYTIYYNGDPIEGTVTIVNGVPTFTETATSL